MTLTLREKLDAVWNSHGCQNPLEKNRWYEGAKTLISNPANLTEHRKRYTSKRTAASGDSSMPSPDL